MGKWICSDCGGEFSEEDGCVGNHDNALVCESCFEAAELARMDDERQAEENGYIAFADPGGRSALRAAGPDNPRNLPCPTCHQPNRLTPLDRSLGYQCDQCADAVERGYDLYS